MEVNGAEQYRRADIIIDAVCNVGNITYMDFVTEKRSVKMSTLRGVCCLIGWEYKVHPRKIAEMIRRSRSNIINQTSRYRKWLSSGDKLTVDYYKRVKQIVSTLI